MSANNPTTGLRPLQQNNSQTIGHQGKKMTVKKTVMGNKVTASADSTGLENNQAMIIKHHHSVKKAQTTSVTRRNARERNRVKGVNDGFGILKKHLSHIGMKNKSSKVETLRGAIEYIKAMRDMLGHPEISEDSKADIKMDFGNNDDDSSTFSDVAGETSPDHSSSETSLSSLHPMVYQLPVSAPYSPSLQPRILTPDLLTSSPPTMLSLSPLTSSPKSPTLEPLERLPSISTTMWWPLPHHK